VTRIRVLVADDSSTVRARLVEVLSGDPRFEVVGEAADGFEAIAMCERLRPDVVTLDLMMPRMTGLQATEHIMAFTPTPIVIVSSSVNRGEAFRSFDALSAGAVEIVEKPAGDDTDDRWERRLLDTVRLVSRIKVMTHPRAKLERRPSPGPPLFQGSCSLIAIGVSTGGPAALSELLGALGRDFPLPILLVTHLSPLFAAPFVEWLDAMSPLPVRFARDGEPLPAPGQGVVVVAPHDVHMIVEQSRLRLVATEERHSCRPSADVLFESLARRDAAGVVACLLTGMGRDGAEGLLAIRRAGGTTVAQDEASCAVFGMPRAAIELGAAEHVLSLSQMAPILKAWAARAHR
jgi:two-component system chemotaxis response regulator CheB